MRFIDLFSAMLTYHQKTKAIPECREMGDKVEAMLAEWERQWPLDTPKIPVAGKKP